ncbi:hypothetical protein [Marinobacterium marinum]|uniref:Uncharacterized protein n=1 Tax=Marinobacterium marinum TaxID=2756129 RepID=A0A7W2ACM9_9GAMM|nr:hypothetical protein [Marinobacterium marinum]MBA4502707.1 hypothetical protein [Marinobacterium marinum]
MARTLFSDNISLFYGQFYIDILDMDDSDHFDMDSAFKYQANGLCGTAHEGKLFFVAGPQDGTAKITIELHDSEPVLNSDCQNVVEGNFSALSDRLYLCEWAHENTFLLNLPCDHYIVRYSIRHMDRDYDEQDDWDLPVDGQEYIIQFWPGHLDTDRIVRADSDMGQYWHRELGKI